MKVDVAQLFKYALKLAVQEKTLGPVRERLGNGEAVCVVPLCSKRMWVY